MEYSKYNELDYAKFIYENGIQNLTHIQTELRLVATYIRTELGHKPKAQTEMMYKWCEENIPDYNINKHYSIIKRALYQSRKKGMKLTNLKQIEIYDYELDYINNCNIINADGDVSKFEHEVKKVMFTFLVRLKINRYISELRSNKEDFQYTGKSFKGGQKKYTELKKEAKLKSSTKINEDVISDLISSGLAKALYGGIIILDFMDDIYDLQEVHKDEEPKIVITDFTAIGWYYDSCCGDNTIRECECCGRLIKAKSKFDASTKYCRECAQKVKNEQKKEYYYRNKG